MRELDLFKTYDMDVAVALGFFDCVHLGHAALIRAAVKRAKDCGINAAVFTFSNDPATSLGGEKQIYAYRDRLELLENLGVDAVVSCKFDESLRTLSPKDFLDALFACVGVKSVFAGADYAFGNGAEGRVEYLKEYALSRGADADIPPFYGDGGKLSSRTLRELVKAGDVEKLNAYLTEPYFMRGQVKSARHVGTKIGFPTANIPIPEDRLSIRDGIYATRILVDGMDYPSMTNVGAKPTFSDDTPSIETYVFDFDGDLYGKDIKLQFFKRTRDVTKFACVEDLKAQLARDEKEIRAYFSE